MRRVVISGVGSVSALGIGVEPLWNAVKAGVSGVGDTRLPRWLGHQIKRSAQVDHDAVASHFSDAVRNTCDPFALFALLAAEEAIAQSGMAPDELAGPRTAVIVGSGVGGFGSLDDGHYAFYAKERSRIHPLTIPRVMANAAASHISMKVGANGPSLAISSACSSATQSIGLGLSLIRAGVVDRAIVGGSEAMITPACARAWELLRVLTPTLCRPFSKGRDGMVLGEGAGILVIEGQDVAQARGAAVLAELSGYGTTSDAKDLLRPDAQGAAAAMRLAIEDAGIAPGNVQYVNAHGTGTFLNDSSESAAMRLVFGDKGGRLCLSSTKPVHGHALGAAGGLELIVTIRAMQEQIAPPTINWIEADPDCDVDAVPDVARRLPIDFAMSNSFAFGGINACLVIGRAP